MLRVPTSRQFKKNLFLFLTGISGHRSSLEYEQLSSPLSPLSASSSRSESPISDRSCGLHGTAASTAGSTVSLHQAGCSGRAESDGTMEYHRHQQQQHQQHKKSLPQAPPPTSSSFCGSVATTTSRRQQSRQQWRRRRKKSEKGSLERKRSRGNSDECGGGKEVITGEKAPRRALMEKGRSSSSGKVSPSLFLSCAKSVYWHLVLYA